MIELAIRIVEAVAGAVAVPVTVKTRLGWCGRDADPVRCQQPEQAGAQLLTLHGRTEQGFKGAGTECVTQSKGFTSDRDRDI